MAFIKEIQTPDNNKHQIKNTIIPVVGTQTASTASWTGNIDVPSLYDGLTIAYFLPYASVSSTNVTLKLTLNNGSKTAAIPCYISSSRLTTHYAKGTNIIMTYWSAGSISIDGTATTDNRWIAHADYNTNTNTWRNIQVNGTQVLATGTGTGALNFKDGTNTTVSYDSGIKIDATDEKVLQQNSTSGKYRPILMGYDEINSPSGYSTTSVTNKTFKSQNLLFTPATGTLTTTNLSITNINGVAVGSTPSFTDTKVTQGNTTTNNWRHIILGNLSWSGTQSDTNDTTDQVYRNNDIKISPGYGRLNMKGNSPQVYLYNNTVNLQTTNNNVSADTWYGFRHYDVNEDYIGLFYSNVQKNGKITTAMRCYNKSSDGQNSYNAMIGINITKAGVISYSVTEPDNFRSAISAGSIRFLTSGDGNTAGTYSSITTDPASYVFTVPSDTKIVEFFYATNTGGGWGENIDSKRIPLSLLQSQSNTLVTLFLIGDKNWTHTYIRKRTYRITKISDYKYSIAPNNESTDTYNHGATTDLVSTGTFTITKNDNAVDLYTVNPIAVYVGY